jgi:hypothetical protein
MRFVTVVVLCAITLLTIGSVLNAELVMLPVSTNTGFATVSVPLILYVVLFAAVSWVLFLAATVVSQGLLLRKVESLSVALQEKDREVQRIKAAFFDESVETLRTVAGRLEQRLRELEPLSAGSAGRAVRRDRMHEPAVVTAPGESLPPA